MNRELPTKIATENDPAKYYAEQFQQVAEAIGMPVAPGHSVIHRVKELVAHETDLAIEANDVDELSTKITELRDGAAKACAIASRCCSDPSCDCTSQQIQRILNEILVLETRHILANSKVTDDSSVH